MKEKRKYVRFLVVTNVKYSLGEDPAKEKDCLSRDLSVKGVKLLVRKKIPVGKKIKLSFYLPPDPEPGPDRGVPRRGPAGRAGRLSPARAVERGEPAVASSRPYPDRSRGRAAAERRRTSS